MGGDVGGRGLRLPRQVRRRRGHVNVPRLLRAADDAEDFYLDSNSQIRMETWTRGRVTLVGDAGYSPGPAVGGGTSLAAVGAYVLAHHLADGNRDHDAAFAAYEADKRELVTVTRKFGPAVVRGIVRARTKRRRRSEARRCPKALSRGSAAQRSGTSGTSPAGVKPST